MLSSSIRIFLFFPCVLCGGIFGREDLPQIPEHDQRQRHSQQQTSLRDEQHDHRIPPPESVADRVVLWYLRNEIEKAPTLGPVVAKEPEKAEAAAKEEERRGEPRRESILCETEHIALEDNEE